MLNVQWVLALALGWSQLSDSIAVTLPSSRFAVIPAPAIEFQSPLPATATIAQRPRRRLGTRSGLCVISPGLLEPENKIWSNRPLFLWQTDAETVTMQRLEVFDAEGRILWEKPLDANAESAVYDGPPLQPGQLYTWQLNWSVQGSETSVDYTFQLMDTEQRHQIAADLQAQLHPAAAAAQSPADQASRQAEYFIDRYLWSDALTALYTIDGSSSDTSSRIKEWINIVCQKE